MDDNGFRTQRCAIPELEPRVFMKCDHAVQLCTCCICGCTVHTSKFLTVAGGSNHQFLADLVVRIIGTDASDSGKLECARKQEHIPSQRHLDKQPSTLITDVNALCTSVDESLHSLCRPHSITESLGACAPAAGSFAGSYRVTAFRR